MSLIRKVQPESLGLLLLFCVVSFCVSLSQSNENPYQPATILDVKRDQSAHSANPSAVRYDISLRVGDTIYVVLFTQPPGSYGVEHIAGHEMLVSVGTDTITFNDILGRSREAAILSRTPDAGQK
jgi:hypothetical protein